MRIRTSFTSKKDKYKENVGMIKEDVAILKVIEPSLDSSKDDLSSVRLGKRPSSRSKDDINQSMMLDKPSSS